MDIVDKMTLVDTGRLLGHDDVPKEEIIIESAIID
jgi:peptidyl-prolyl cis-trans isomerase B (cyclophilin B)